MATKATQTASTAGDAEAKAPEKKLYRLKRPFWNGLKMEPIGTERYFVEGNQPSSAELVERKAEEE